MKQQAAVTQHGDKQLKQVTATPPGPAHTCQRQPDTTAQGAGSSPTGHSWVTLAKTPSFSAGKLDESPIYLARLLRIKLVNPCKVPK